VLLALPDFLAIDGHIRWGFNPDPDLAAFEAQHGDTDSWTYADRLERTTRENQHDEPASSMTASSPWLY
jgi:hypothetical protein